MKEGNILEIVIGCILIIFMVIVSVSLLISAAAKGLDKETQEKINDGRMYLIPATILSIDSHLMRTRRGRHMMVYYVEIQYQDEKGHMDKAVVRGYERDCIGDNIDIYYDPETKNVLYRFERKPNQLPLLVIFGGLFFLTLFMYLCNKI